MAVSAQDFPRDSLLSASTAEGDYTDAFAVEVPGEVTLARYLQAFYTTPLFRSEGLVLRLAGRGPKAADLDALAAGTGERFAAWTVTQRRPDEILLRDVSGRTGSWFRAEALGAGTRLWFGSAVMASDRADGKRDIGRLMRLLVPAHRLYSRALLASAARRVQHS